MKIKILTILLLIPLLGLAQSPMSVSSFERMDNDMDARINYPKKDQNSKTCAIIKIETTLPLNEFTFDGGMSGVIDTKQGKGEIWLYQSPGSRYITINHESHTPLRQYQYSEPLQEATVYVMKLISAKKITTYEEVSNFQYLIISCNVPGAIISINNNEGEAFSNGLFKKRMEFGKYTYEVTAPMYLPFVGQFELNTNDKYEIDAKLIPNFATLTINSIPEQGADIIINDEPKGKTPLVIDRMVVGTHDISLRQAMYKTYNDKLIVELPKAQTLNITMQPMFANIAILADENSGIYINDEYKSNGSWTGRLTQGHYKLESKKVSHQSFIENIEVEEGKDLKITLSNPTPIIGRVDIDCLSEIGADIYIDDKPYGKTPNIIEGLLIGERILRIEKDGFEVAEQKIVIEQGKLLEVKVELKRKPLIEQKPIRLSILIQNDSDRDAYKNYPKKDKNGKTCAIIKIKTEIPLSELSFYGGMRGVIDVVQKKRRNMGLSITWCRVYLY